MHPPTVRRAFERDIWPSVDAGHVTAIARNRPFIIEIGTAMVAERSGGCAVAYSRVILELPGSQDMSQIEHEIPMGGIR